MAKIYTIYNPIKIVAPDTQVNELEFGTDRGIEGPSPDASGGRSYDFRDPLVPSPTGKSDERITLFVKILTGSFKMNVGSDPTSNPADLTAGDTFTVTVQNRVQNLWFLASSAGDSFFVSA